MRTLAVVGAGPIGLAAALSGIARGFAVTVFEAAGGVGASLLRWGNARFFTPLSMNLSPRFADILGPNLPGADALLTGGELVTQVLAPLARSPTLAPCLRLGQRVLSIGRKGLTRLDFAGHPLRAERPFRLLVAGPDGEYWFEADAVLDASGASQLPTWLGEGGVPAPGERAIAPRLIRDLGALAARRAELADRRVVLIGHGHSAANAIVELEALALEAPSMSVSWVVRTPNQRPCVDVASDPLPERRRVVGRANALAARPPAWLRLERCASLQSIAERSGALQASFSGGRQIEADFVVGLTGFRPELEFVSELQLAISPSSEGGHALTRALANITDCLSVPQLRPADLASGEPGFYLVGAKGYGRARTFLLQTGYAQVESVLDTLGSEK